MLDPVEQIEFGRSIGLFSYTAALTPPIKMTHTVARQAHRPLEKSQFVDIACRWHNRCLCRPTGNSAFPAGSSKINYNLSAAAERPEETDQCGQSEKRPGA
jgi:hypothetical protein